MTLLYILALLPLIIGFIYYFITDEYFRAGIGIVTITILFFMLFVYGLAGLMKI